jgi:hypothetical protein
MAAKTQVLAHIKSFFFQKFPYTIKLYYRKSFFCQCEIKIEYIFFFVFNIFIFVSSQIFFRSGFIEILHIVSSSCSYRPLCVYIHYWMPFLCVSFQSEILFLVYEFYKFFSQAQKSKR